MHLLLHIELMKSLECVVRNLTFNPYEMEYDSQLRRLLMNSKAIRGDDLLLNELWLPSGRCRSDLAVVNGELEGFEIKAGRDRLDRLPRQIQEYDRLFRYSNIVTVPPHLRSIEAMVPSNWGVWVALGEGRTLRLRCLRPATANFRRDTVYVARLLTRDECISKLKALGCGKGTSRMSKEALVQRVGLALTITQIDAYLCECLHARAKLRGLEFELDAGGEERGEATLSLSHLASLAIPASELAACSAMGTAAAMELSHESSPVNPQARARLLELRVEFANVARKEAERRAQTRRSTSVNSSLRFFPPTPRRD
jgi:hypothetical protein